jgi:hypothetical protein
MFLFIVSLLFLSISTSAEWKPVAAHLLDKGEAPIMVQASEQPSNTITLQYQTPVPSFKLVSHQNVNGTLTKRCFLGNARLHSVPGEPEVPYIYSRIILPQGRTVESIKIVPKTTIEAPGRHMLTYGEIPHTISSTEITWAKPNMSIYGSDAVYPAKTHELVDIQFRCGVTIAYVNIYPVQYMPNSGKLQYFNEFTIEVTTKPALQVNNSIAVRVNRFFENYTMTEENPAMLSTYKNTVVRSSFTNNMCNPKQPYSYLIVADESFIGASTTPSLDDLVALRTSQGFSCKVESIQNVLANSSGSDDKNKLRNYIKEAYNNWETKWVCLAGDPGDPELIPCFVLDGTHPSDMPLQCLEQSSWNNDYEAEVFIGRISAENADECANQIYKILAYENSSIGTPYLTEGLSCGEELDSRTYGKEAMQELAGYFPSDKWSWQDLHDEDGDWSKSELKDIINSNTISIINHLGHSNSTYNMKLRNGDEDDFTNTNFIFHKTQGCIPGKFTVDCIAERFTTENRNGMFAAVMNSNNGYYSPGNPTGGSSHQIHRQLWKACWEEDMDYFGEFNEYSHRTNTSRRRDIIESNLFGCPAIKFKGKITGPYLQVLKPTSGIFYVADKLTVQWEVGGGATVDNVKIEYSIDGGSTYQDIIATTPNTSTYEWTIPDIAGSEQCMIQVSEVGGTLIGQSGLFTIAQKAAIALNPASLLAQAGTNQTVDKDLVVQNQGKGQLTFSIRAAGAPTPILINELFVSVDAMFDGLEIWNKGEDQDMTGWKVSWIDNQGTSGSYSFESGFVFKAGGTVVLTDENSGTNDSTFYVGGNMYWDQGQTELSVAVLDADGMGVDFVRSSGNSDDPPAGTEWSGTGVNLDQDFVYRMQNADNDDPGDWSSGSSGTINQLNAGQTNSGADHWLVFAPKDGIVAGLQSLTVKVTFNSAGLATGEYKDTLIIIHNSADITSPTLVPCLFQVDMNPIVNTLHAITNYGIQYYNSRLTYQIPSYIGTKKQQVSIKLFNVQGRLIKTLVNEPRGTGIYRVDLNANRHVASGIYFAKMKVANFNKTIKIIKK